MVETLATCIAAVSSRASERTRVTTDPRSTCSSVLVSVAACSTRCSVRHISHAASAPTSSSTTTARVKIRRLGVIFGEFCNFSPKSCYSSRPPRSGRVQGSFQGGGSSLQAPLLVDVVDERRFAGFEPLRQRVDADLIERFHDRQVRRGGDALQPLVAV